MLKNNLNVVLFTFKKLIICIQKKSFEKKTTANNFQEKFVKFYDDLRNQK